MHGKATWNGQYTFVTLVRRSEGYDVPMVAGYLNEQIIKLGEPEASLGGVAPYLLSVEIMKMQANGHSCPALVLDTAT